MTDELEQARRQLEATRRQLQLLADTVGHDLRAPLRTIESFAARLADSAGARLDERERGYLQRVREAAARMTALLDALGALSQATHAELTPVDVDLSLLAEWVLAELQDAEPERPLAYDIQPGLLAHGDERLLKTLLTQLLRNAWRFSPPAAPVRIEVSGMRRGDRLVLQVRDHGIGFDMRYAHKLFEPLQRLHSAEEGGGHGLGLAVARRIVERHGGTITATSRSGDGATFSVELPAARIDPDRAR